MIEIIREGWEENVFLDFSKKILIFATNKTIKFNLKKQKIMKKNLYDAIYRLFNEMDYGLVITVGQVSLKLYEPDKENNTVWEKGIEANGTPYTVEDLHADGLGPGTYAELFAGEYDIIEGFAEQIYNDEFNR